MISKSWTIPFYFCLIVITALGAADDQTKQVPPRDLVDEANGHGLVVSRAIGGTAGDTLSKSYLAPGARIAKMDVDWKAAIDGIVMITAKPDEARYQFGHMGGNGKNPQDTNHEHFVFEEGEYLTSIDLQVGQMKHFTVITGIRFHFNRRAVIELGTKGPFNHTLSADNDSEIVGFWGWTGGVIDEIGIITRKRK